MSDEADLAQAYLEHSEELRRKYSVAAPPEAIFTGFCLNCGEPTKEPQRWCDATCRNTWQGRKNR